MAKRLYLGWLCLVVLFFVMMLPVSVKAEGYLDYVQDITLGQAVTGMTTENDYTYNESGISYSAGTYYWDIYKFTFENNGDLNIFFESSEKTYLSNQDDYNGFALYSTESPDQIIWKTYPSDNQITYSYSQAKDIYSGSKTINLDKGSYYFAIKHKGAIATSYTLTLSYTEPIINMSAINLNKTKIALDIGDTYTLTATVLPENATDKTYRWKSDNTDIATVSDGLVTAVAPGTTKISAVSIDGEVYGVCEVVVNDIPVKSITLNKTEIKLDVNGTETLNATVLPENATNKEIKWETSDDNVVTVNNGLVTAISNGTAIITALSSSDNSIKQECRVTVGDAISADIAVSSVTLNKTSMELAINGTETLIATALPENATDKTIKWITSDPGIVTVDNGVVKAVGYGSAEITASSSDGKESAKCSVIVKVGGWLDDIEEIEIDKTKTGVISKANYSTYDSWTRYWKGYRFTVPKDSILELYIESTGGEFFDGYGVSANYNFYNANNPDKSILSFQIDDNFSSARNMYYGSYLVPLQKGTYYMTIDCGTTDNPYSFVLRRKTIYVSWIELDHASIEMENNTSATIKAKVSPENADNSNVIWTSSNEYVAKVDGGKITAVGYGTANIKATAVDGSGTYAVCSVTVKKPVENKTENPEIEKIRGSKVSIGKIKGGKKRLTINYGQIGGGVKYQIAYKTSSGKWSVKFSTKTKFVLKKLKSKKKYYVRVRCYKNIDGKTYYGKWSAVKKCKVK